MPVVGHRCHIFDPHPADLRIIQPGLDRNNLALFENCLLEPGMFMNIQSKPMASAVEEANLPAFAHFGRESAGGEQSLDLVMNSEAISSRLHFLERELLPCEDNVPHPSLRFASPTTHDAASHVAEISGLRVAWENIENDQ